MTYVDRKKPHVQSFPQCHIHASTEFILFWKQVIFKLNYIPHETLQALLHVLKQIWAGTLAGGVAGIEFGVVALKSFHK